MEEKSTELTVGNDIIKDLQKACKPAVFEALKLTETEKKNIIEYVIRIKYGSTTWLALTCSGAECIYKESCPLVEAKKAPLGKKCPFEELAIQAWERDYISALGTDMEDKIDRTQIHELIESDLMIARANTMLGLEGFIMDNPVGVDQETGQAINRKEEHIAINVRERAQKRRDKLMKAFLATRESKANVIAKTSDPAAYQATLRTRMQEELDKKKVINAETVPEEQNNEL